MAQLHITTNVQWITRILRAIAFWALVFPLAAFILGGPWCLAAVLVLQVAIVALIWRAVRG
ncbi:hypothetical protein LWF15_02980 [Kineosporia rhizophila]|uniref:hypothetical protein n=1 Tax=Kineosporia TaxID=49184 RepID=UPI000AD59191|nr:MULTISPECIES: hypothetical protein [Kineosporia]MCE0534462.1 hypothetical protein [Kineosporia rhizophila]GLY13996.1 hypothetical protein Kisp01_10120 [Kineosporia sp. NBRC 101677]